MAALTSDRDTPRLEGEIQDYGIAAATVLYGGSLICLDAAGYLVPGSVSTTLTAVGRCERRVDNSTGAAGDKTAKARPGTFRFNNSASTEAIAIADIGKDCFIVDDQTVTKTNGGNSRSRAGKVVAVDALGVWVSVGITKG